MSTYFGRTVRFVAGAAEVCSHTVLFAIQNGFDGIVDTAEVGSFYLSHMTSLACREVYDIFQSITPFVCNYFCVDAFFVHNRTYFGKSLDLSLLFAHIDRTFDTKFEGFGYLCQFAYVVGNSLSLVVENDTERTVNIDMNGRVILFERFELYDTAS